MLATQTTASPWPLGTPWARRRGSTTRDRVATLAATDPFIGASSAPSPMAETSGPDRWPPIAAVPARNRIPASGRRFSSAPIST
nr:hypothetical protein [Azospirillum sp. B510]